MIELKRPNGTVALSAYTVAELIVELQKHPQDLPVVFTWEGQQIGFDADRIQTGIFKLTVAVTPHQTVHYPVLELYAE